ncbi:MAG: M16 family metallopeptidase [Chlamydiota bacterium]
MRKRVFLGPALAMLLALTALAQTAAQAPKLPPVHFQDLHLDNGLRVILAPDHAAPVFGICVTYNVGSRDERPGRTGFAHLFEHMMFEGSQNVGKGEHFILVENNGGGMNGTTNEDRTNYFEVLPKNQLDLALFLEADRMAHLAVNQPNLDNQRNAVQEERRLGIDNQPYGKSYLEIDNLSYDNFAYKHSTIGSMRDLNAADLSDVQDFFRIYYAPNNAVLTLVGDFDPAVALEKVKKYFGAIPRQPAPPAPDVTEGEHYGERRETIYDPLARLPMLLISYHIPAGNTPDNYALRVLGDILGEGESSRFYQHLVKEQQLATAIEVQADARRGPSLFYVMATPRPGVKPEDLEQAIYKEIGAAAKDGVTAAEMDKARTQFRRAMIQTRESALHTAIRMGQYAVYFNDPGLINTIVDKYDAVTAEQVKAAAQKYLVTTERAVITTLPEKQAGAAAGGR